MIALLLAVIFSANQGSALQLTFANEPGVKSVEITWGDKKIPASLVGDQWTTILGVDLDAKPGKHAAGVLFTMQDGRVDQREAVIDVEHKKYPTTELKVDEKYVELSKPDLARANRETKETEAIYATITNEMLWDQPFSVPIPGESGTNFGHRRIFNGQPRAPHAGADLHAQTGTPIQATNRGRVVLAKNLFFTGNTVILDHGLGVYSLYAHLSRIDVKPGDMVSNGQLLGLAGATGRVTGPHLHWGMRVQGARVDPFTLVDMAK
ncbi:MAG TPA: peptidoglycan DD-metalloendopeptidase family protein [Terriglobia bacterium]|nr:peptidoglycan DD-metalloendopeptidase family protein [Terriglobia bacterium]